MSLKLQTLSFSPQNSSIVAGGLFSRSVRRIGLAAERLLIGVVGLLFPIWGYSSVNANVFDVQLHAGSQPLKVWNLKDLSALKTAQSKELHPLTGKMVNIKGVLLSQVLERSLEGLTVEQKAQVDLLIFKGDQGAEVLLPRSVVTKYPVILGLQNDAASLILPWTSKPKLREEGLPLEKIHLPKFNRLQLTNYREKFEHLFLKKRTDPVAMRGEKIFLQNCLNCHADGKGRSLGPEGKHPTTLGAPRLNDRDLRSLVSYLEAFKNVAQAQTVR